MTISHLFVFDTQSPGSPPQAEPAHSSPSVSLVGKRVIIVEDEGITQMHLRRMLTRAGLHVVGSAVNGEKGVALALQERPDIVMMDIQMPGAFNGLEAARRILSAFRTCVIILSAYSDYQAEAQQIGTSGYILKPVDSTTLLPELQQAFEAFHRR